MKTDKDDYSLTGIFLKFTLSAMVTGVMYYLAFSFAQMLVGDAFLFWGNWALFLSLFVVPLAAGVAGIFRFDQVLGALDRALSWMLGRDE